MSFPHIYKRKLINIISLFVVLSATALVLQSSSSDTAWTSSSERRCQSKVNVLLGVESDHERWHVDYLTTDANVVLSDQHTSMVDTLRQPELEYTGLESPLEELANG